MANRISAKSILYITPHQPDRTSCGSELRAHHIRRALEEIGKVHVVVTEPADPATQEREYSRIPDTFPVRPVARKRLRDKIRWMTDPCAPFPHGNRIESAAEAIIQGYAREHDLVWFNKLRTPNALVTWSWPHSVVDIDDVPSTYEYTMMTGYGSFIARLQSAARYFSWRRRERLLGRRFDVLAVCSEADRAYLQRLRVNSPIHVIPNGSVRPKNIPARNPSRSPRIGFVGLLDYFPNREGVLWFIEKCWPSIKKRVPDARLRLAGKGSHELIRPGFRDIDPLGWIPDLEAETESWSLMIVPVRIGAGTREKIAYGFGIQCPIVSTPLGAMGYDVSHGEELLLAKSAKEFAHSCTQIICNEVDTSAMVQRAYQKYLRNWTWDSIAPRVWEAAEDCLRVNHRSRFVQVCESAS